MNIFKNRKNKINKILKSANADAINHNIDFRSDAKGDILSNYIPDYPGVEFSYNEILDEFKCIKDLNSDKQNWLGDIFKNDSFVYDFLLEKGVGPGIEIARSKPTSNKPRRNWSEVLSFLTQSNFISEENAGMLSDLNQSFQPPPRSTAQYIGSRDPGDMSNLIIDNFISAGYPLHLAKAAVINAKAESNLNPNAIGDGGKSVGLFQLHDRGVGRGMTVEDRKNPQINIEKIIGELERRMDETSGSFPSIRTALARGTSIAELASLFCYYVERPLARVRDARKRSNMAISMYGSEANRINQPWPNHGAFEPYVRSARVHIVRAGETLADIARMELGDVNKWIELWQLNRHNFPNPNLIEVGDQVLLPE